MPGHILAQVRLDLGLIHAGEEVPGLVVGADVLQAKMTELAQAIPGFGGSIVAAELAIGPVAQTARRAAGIRRIQLDLTWRATLAHR